MGSPAVSREPESIRTIESLSDLSGFGPEWRRLFEHLPNPDILFSFPYYRELSGFVSDANRLMVLAHTTPEGVDALLPLMRGKFDFHGIPVPVARSLGDPRHTCACELLCECGKRAELDGFLRAGFARSGVHMMVLESVSERSALYGSLRRGNGTAGFGLLFQEQQENCLVEFEGTMEQYERTRAPKFMKNVRAAERKAAASGPVALLASGRDLDHREALRRGLEVESASWKGERGSAIRMVAKMESFFRNLADALEPEGKLDLYLLTHRGEDVGFLYCIRDNGTTRALKIGIRDDRREIAPGMLLVRRVLAERFAEGGAVRFDFCGGNQRWKRDWSNARERYYRVYVFRDTMTGTALHWMARRYMEWRRRGEAREGGGGAVSR